MKPIENGISDCHVNHDAASRVVDFIMQVIQTDEGFLDFHLSPQERNQLIVYLASNGHPITGSEHTGELLETARDGIKFLKRQQEYKDRQITLLHRKIREKFNEHKLPLAHFPELTDSSYTFQPKDCMALQEWPNHRKPVDGSGRLENAGQFVQRLFDEKLYDEKKFGKLYLFDLRAINPKLYQALVQWQKRTGEKILPTKQDEIDELLQKSADEELGFIDTSRVNNARWRRQQATPQP